MNWQVEKRKPWGAFCGNAANNNGPTLGVHCLWQFPTMIILSWSAAGILALTAAVAVSWWLDRRERAAYIATLSARDRERLQGWERTGYWHRFREIENKSAGLKVGMPNYTRAIR